MMIVGSAAERPAVVVQVQVVLVLDFLRGDRLELDLPRLDGEPREPSSSSCLTSSFSPSFSFSPSVGSTTSLRFVVGAVCMQVLEEKRNREMISVGLGQKVVEFFRAKGGSDLVS
jgi:hypothetical protein